AVIFLSPQGFVAKPWGLFLSLRRPQLAAQSPGPGEVKIATLLGRPQRLAVQRWDQVNGSSSGSAKTSYAASSCSASPPAGAPGAGNGWASSNRTASWGDRPASRAGRTNSLGSLIAGRPIPPGGMTTPLCFTTNPLSVMLWTVPLVKMLISLR